MDFRAGAEFLPARSSRLLILGTTRGGGKNTIPERMLFDILVDDAAAEFKRIVALGAVAVQEPYAFDEGEEGMRLIIATLADLDGNYFQRC
ncbi:MAG: VOC family protein [Anaerolineae bacterium]